MIVALVSPWAKCSAETSSFSADRDPRRKAEGSDWPALEGLRLCGPDRRWMREAEHDLVYDAPFAEAVFAFQSRYSAPHASHVATEDTLARAFDPVTRCLHTVRLVKKTRKSLPKWLPSRLAAIRDTWVLERTILDVDNQLVLSVSRNLTHRANADGVEWQALEGRGSVTASSTFFSILSQTASQSVAGPFVQRQIENAFIAGNRASVERSRAGFQFVLDVLADPHLRSTFLYGERDPVFARGTVFQPSMLHAEHELAGFSGHGITSDEDRYAVRQLQPEAKRSFFSLSWREREKQGDDIVDKPRVKPLREWLGERWRALSQRQRRPGEREHSD